MIVFLTVVYVLLLYALTKAGRVPDNKWTWLTIIPYELVLLIGFFIPMQWGAPSGDVRTLAYSVAITPNVSGEVVEVPVEPDSRVSEGDVLFKIDPVPYQAALDGLVAKLELAELRLAQAKTLARQDAGTLYEVQSYQSQVDSLKAGIVNAEYNLAETVVRAPSDGLVTYVGLRPGARVANFPFFKAMAFVDTSEVLLGAQVAQIHSRFIEPGQEAEVTFKYLPGEVHAARVMYIMPATAQGQVQITGMASAPMEAQAGPFFVRLALADPELAASLIPGSLGTVAIYTSRVRIAHVIRRVMIRLAAIRNYVLPN